MVFVDAFGTSRTIMYTSINTYITIINMIANFKTASITELRQNATVLINDVNKFKEPVFILQNSKKAAVLIDDETFQKMVQSYVDSVDYNDGADAILNHSNERYTLADLDVARAKSKKKKA